MHKKMLPVNPSILSLDNKPSNLTFSFDESTSFRDKDVAIIGYDPEITNPIRESLYQLSFYTFKEISIVDLGDSMYMTHEEIAELIYSLIQQSVFPILIGFSEDIITSISNLWGKHILPHSIGWIDSQIDENVQTELEQNIFIKKQFFIGLQRHLLQEKSLQIIQSSVKPIFLSEFRKNNSVIESYIRNSEIIYINLNSIRNSDFPFSGNPSGYYSEEIISLAKHTGSSDKSSLVVISDWRINEGSSGIHSTLISHMIWYILEGYILKLKDHRSKSKNLTHYVVELKNSEIHLDFFKSESSGKWWIKEPNQEENYHGNLIPCTYEEYLKTVHENLPERLLELIYQ